MKVILIFVLLEKRKFNASKQFQLCQEAVFLGKTKSIPPYNIPIKTPHQCKALFSCHAVQEVDGINWSLLITSYAQQLTIWVHFKHTALSMCGISGATLLIIRWTNALFRVVNIVKMSDKLTGLGNHSEVRWIHYIVFYILELQNETGAI